MCDRDDENRFAVENVGEVAGKHRTIYPAITADPFSPKEWIASNAGADFCDL